MKTTMIKNKIVAATLLAAGFGIALAAVAPKRNLARADVNPQGDRDHRKKIRIHAESDHAQKGQPVILSVTSLDRVHGFMSKPLKFDTDIVAGKTTEVAVTPDTAGNFTVICDHYCGTGHGGMKMTIAVVQ